MNRLLALIPVLILFVSCNHEIDDEQKIENETKLILPSINIIKNEPIEWDNMQACRIIYFDGYDEYEINAKIKERGGFSRKYDKKSYRIELDKALSLCNLPIDDDWILNANYVDKTFMRHKISYDLYRQMNENNIAPLCSYINIKINDEDKGLYVLMQKVNASMIGLDKNDSLAMLFKDPPIFRKEKLKYVQDSLNYYHQKFPKKNDKTYYIEAFIDFIFNSSNENFVNNVENWVDIDNLIDWHILLLFSNNGDGLMKNFYFYKLDSNTPFRFSIWDYDHTFGRDGDNELNMLERLIECNNAILIERLTEINETGYSLKLKKRWFELRELDIISLKNFTSLVEENHKIIKNDLKNNFEIWPVHHKWYYDHNTYEQEILLMLEYVKRRIEQLDEYFKQAE